jgi:hypothetical protein
MKTARVCLLALSSTGFAAAQDNPFSAIISDVVSVYTEVSSILASAASQASVAATASPSASATETSQDTGNLESSAITQDSSSTSPSSSSTYSSFAFGSPTTTSDSTASTSQSSSHHSFSSYPTRTSTFTTLSSTSGGSSTVLGAASETGTNNGTSPGSSSHHSNLGIILGSVLGALALGLILLALIVCCRRRRRRGSSIRHSALSPSDDEVEGWRKTPPPGMLGAGAARHNRGTSGAAPLMAEHPAYRDGVRHENPFVPVPPPPRRGTPNARTDLGENTAYAGYGGNPFDDHHEPVGLSNGADPHRHHHKGEVAAGLTAAAIGAGAMHHHDKRKHDIENALTNEKVAEEPYRQPSVSRKPVPITHVNNGEAWPYAPVSPVHAEHIDDIDALAASRTPPRTSTESRRSYSRDAARANAAFDEQYAPRADNADHRHHGLEAGAAGVAAGALGGAALARHHEKKDRSRSRSTSADRRRSQPLPAALTTLGSDHSSSSNDSTNNNRYSDALDRQPTENLKSIVHPQNDLYGVPVAPPSRSHRNSSLGPAPAPAYTQNRPTMPSPLSTEIYRDPSHSPPRQRDYRRRSTSAPRNSLPFEPMAHDYGAYPVFPPNNRASMPATGYDSFPTYADAPPSSYPNPDKAIVGDNGYPHMGVPRRKSGGEYDFATSGPFGPQTLPNAPSNRRSAENSRNSTMMTHKSGSSEEDGGWRMSMGLPGGWNRGRSSDASRRKSGEGRRLRASDFVGDEERGYGWAQ